MLAVPYEDAMSTNVMESRAIRLWPGVAAVAVQWMLVLALPLVMKDASGLSMMGAAACGLVVVVWWLFFSRIPLPERIGGIVFAVAAAALTPRFLDKSIATGMMGMMFYIKVIPGMSLALVGWAALAQRWPSGTRRMALAGAIVAACAVWALYRTDGITGEGGSQLAWRWTPTAEQILLAKEGARPAAQAAPEPEAIPAAPLKPERADVRTAAVAAKVPAVPETGRAAGEWPGFRGTDRDGAVSGIPINTDWKTSPPVEIWRRAAGPAWSSFAVRNGRVYTQEQRGEYEIASCYDAATGRPVWTHADNVRFWESNAGAGPRGTPTLDQGSLYTMGATGILNALNAGNGALRWTRDTAADTGAKVPTWGIASSPLVTDGKVIVAASGRLAAYDAQSGNLVWKGTLTGGSYSSPHLAEIGGVSQVLFLNDKGLSSVALTTGEVLWQHAWPGFSSLQPALTGDGGVLIVTGDAAGGNGTRRLKVEHGSGAWKVEEMWTSRGLKPYFNDMVIHKGHAYGFDGGILAAINLEDGSRKWKGGRYGHGQLILLRDQDLLLVISEDGELALVSATPDEYKEIARVRALDEKTWNHPVLAGDTLLVRNSKEMAAYRLALAAR